jgi:hypothetical protein
MEVNSVSKAKAKTGLSNSVCKFRVTSATAEVCHLHVHLAGVHFFSPVVPTGQDLVLLKHKEMQSPAQCPTALRRHSWVKRYNDSSSLAVFFRAQACSKTCLRRRAVTK